MIYSAKMDRHFAFTGPKKLTSRGWHRWVELDGRQQNATLFLLHCFLISGEKWELRLSPIRTQRPLFRLQNGEQLFQTNPQSRRGQTI